MELFLAQPKVGRKGYDKIKMFVWLMYKHAHACTYRDLESVSGIHHSTFVKFRKRLSDQRWFEEVFTELTVRLAEYLPELEAILDGSFVETYSKRDEEGSGYSGHKEKNGFKLHQIIEYKTRLPLLQCVSPGNVHDIVGGRTLISRAPPDWNVIALEADRGYDSELFVKEVSLVWKDVEVAIPMRHMNHDGNALNRKKRGAGRSKDPTLYKHRTEIERYFSRKKRIFHLGGEKTRHLNNFRINCYMTSIMEILEWLSNQNLFAF